MTVNCECGHADYSHFEIHEDALTGYSGKYFCIGKDCDCREFCEVKYD